MRLFLTDLNIFYEKIFLPSRTTTTTSLKSMLSQDFYLSPEVESKTYFASPQTGILLAK